MAPSPRQGLVEYLVVFLLLALAAAGALAYFREPLARALGSAPHPARRASGPPASR